MYIFLGRQRSRAPSLATSKCFYYISNKASASCQVLDDTPHRTILSWNSLLAPYSKSPGTLQDALCVFARIPSPDVVSFNTLLSCYLINSDIINARHLFNTMPVKDVASWNIMVSGLSRNGMLEDARKLFDEMPQRNSVSWNVIVSGCVHAGDLSSAKEYFNRAPDRKEIILQTAMIAGNMAAGNVRDAEVLFGGMPIRNAVSWNAMVSGYVENGRAEDGLKLFKRMIYCREVKPNSSTLCSALLGCSNLSSLTLGKQIHQLTSKLPLNLDPSVGTSLVSMYCKCGDINDASKVFKGMHLKDVVTWNAMISGYAQHGHGAKAIQLFDRLWKEGIRPNGITFIGVLTACNHAGFAELGVLHFESMKDKYGVEPQPDHYTCMVDLLCRTGLLSKAVHIICTMPFKPHPAVFGILLGACRLHKNVEVAEFAARSLVELDPLGAGAYVQLANLYASMNCWSEVSRVRRWMKGNRAVKTPGCSWIELRGIIHEFRSGDRLHPQLEQIHKRLFELERRIKEAGYVPDLELALHNVAEEQKELLLLRHSEKLAVAFGLISTSPGMVLRVFKNLRVCGDCHNAIKIISRTELREIILRDTMRFHHFRNGTCSCGDYW